MTGGDERARMPAEQDQSARYSHGIRKLGSLIDTGLMTQGPQ